MEYFEWFKKALLRFKDFDGRVGASDLSGQVRIESGGRLRVDAELASRRLDIDDLAAVLGARVRTDPSGRNTEAPIVVGGKLLPDAKLGRVVGMAASDLLEPENPRAAVNRRITITVLTHEAEERLMGKKNVVFPLPSPVAEKQDNPASSSPNQ